MGGAAPVILLAVFFASMFFDSGRESQVILLSDPDGSVGSVEVSTAAGKALLDEAGQMTIASSSAAPSEPVKVSEKAIEQEFSALFAAEPAQPARFLLYFEQGSTELTAASRQLLQEILAEAKQRGSYNVGIYGHSDRTGSSEYNLQLSWRRAIAVRELLVESGVERKTMDVDSHGEGNPLVPTGDGVAEPLNRRVEVIVR